MRLLLIYRALLVVLFALVAGEASAGKVALVIGNGAYQNTAKLPNPAGDAVAFARFLSEVGFEVTLASDATRAEMSTAVAQFSRALKPDDTAVFFYAGHGLQMAAENYLLGVEAKLATEFDVPAETISLNTVLELMEEKAHVSMIFIDACRNNPFADNLGKATRAVSRGLAPVVVKGEGTMIAFAATPGNVAFDGDDVNSPFTTALLKHLGEPGLEVGTAFKRVIRDVRADTGDRQSPQMVSTLAVEIYFGGEDEPEGGEDTPDTAVLPKESEGDEAAKTDVAVLTDKLPDQPQVVAAPRPNYARTLTFCSEGSPEGFDPALYYFGTSLDASSRTVYSRLVEFEHGGTSIVPGLAASWDVSADALEYTFHLRPGVKFHTTASYKPSRDLTAEDVVFSFERQWKSDNPWFAYLGNRTYDYFNALDFPNLLREIVAVDDLTVKFVLNHPDSAFVANLALDFSTIVSKEYADRLLQRGEQEKLDSEPVGTGPFILTDYQLDSQIRYAANPSYWGEAQPTETLVFDIVPDASERKSRLLSGDCDIMSYPNPSDLAELKASPDVVVEQQAGLNVGYLAYNTRQPPFDRAPVRRALNMAIDKEAIIEAVYGGHAVPAVNPIPPTMWAWNDAIRDDPYDPVAAREALEAAGVTDLKMKIWAMPVARPYNPNGKLMAEMIKENFAAIGVEVAIVTMDWPDYLQKSSETDRDGAVLLGWGGDNGDPDNFLAMLLSCDQVGGNNRAQWCNEEYDALIREAKFNPSQAERAVLYKRAQEIFKEEAPWATIAHSAVDMPMRRDVLGYAVDPIGTHRFDGVGVLE